MLNRHCAFNEDLTFFLSHGSNLTPINASHKPYNNENKYGTIVKAGSKNVIGQVLETYKSFTIAHVNTSAARGLHGISDKNPCWPHYLITWIEPCVKGENTASNRICNPGNEVTQSTSTFRLHWQNLNYRTRSTKSFPSYLYYWVNWHLVDCHQHCY